MAEAFRGADTALSWFRYHEDKAIIMNLTPRHCPYCANAGCALCHAARMGEVAVQSDMQEATDFFRHFLKLQGADAKTPLDHNTHVLLVEAIRFGKETARGQRLIDDAQVEMPLCNRFDMLEFERVTLIPQTADIAAAPPWMQDKRKVR